jgi:hypothetical protein
MIKCDVCAQQSQLGERTFKIPSRTRSKIYPRRAKVNRHKFKLTDDSGGVGWEIVAEAAVCKNCWQQDQELGEHPQ